MRPRRARPDDREALTDLVRKLGALLAELELSEIEVNQGETRIRVSRTPPAQPVLPAMSPAVQTPGGLVADAPGSEQASVPEVNRPVAMALVDLTGSTRHLARNPPEGAPRGLERLTAVLAVQVAALEDDPGVAR